jgi:hypothetical protein
MSYPIYSGMPISMAKGLHKNPNLFSVGQSNAAAMSNSFIQVKPYATWDFEFDMDAVQGNESQASSVIADFMGLLMACGGRAGLFLFEDPQDNAVTNVQFGTGDGSTTAFQLSRPIGGFGAVDVIQNLNGNPTVYVNGTPTSAFSVSSTGVVTFMVAPALNAVLSWSGQFYYLCRFSADTCNSVRSYTTNNGTDQWDVDSIKFSSEFVAPGSSGLIQAGVIPAVPATFAGVYIGNTGGNSGVAAPGQINVTGGSNVVTSNVNVFTSAMVGWTVIVYSNALHQTEPQADYNYLLGTITGFTSATEVTVSSNLTVNESNITAVMWPSSQNNSTDISTAIGELNYGIQNLIGTQQVYVYDQSFNMGEYFQQLACLGTDQTFFVPAAANLTGQGVFILNDPSNYIKFQGFTLVGGGVTSADCVAITSWTVSSGTITFAVGNGVTATVGRNYRVRGFMSTAAETANLNDTVFTVATSSSTQFTATTSLGNQATVTEAGAASRDINGIVGVAQGTMKAPMMNDVEICHFPGDGRIYSDPYVFVDTQSKFHHNGGCGRAFVQTNGLGAAAGTTVGCRAYRNWMAGFYGYQEIDSTYSGCDASMNGTSGYWQKGRGVIMSGIDFEVDLDNSPAFPGYGYHFIDHTQFQLNSCEFILGAEGSTGGTPFQIDGVCTGWEMNSCSIDAESGYVSPTYAFNVTNNGASNSSGSIRNFSFGVLSSSAYNIGSGANVELFRNNSYVSVLQTANGAVFNGTVSTANGNIQNTEGTFTFSGNSQGMAGIASGPTTIACGSYTNCVFYAISGIAQTALVTGTLGIIADVAAGGFATSATHNYGFYEPGTNQNWFGGGIWINSGGLSINAGYIHDTTGSNGTSGQVLTVSASTGYPVWSTPAASGTVNSGTSGHIAYYASSTTAVSSDSNLDDGATTANTLTYAGSAGIAAKAIAINGGTAITGQSGTGGTVAMTASPTFTGTVTVATLAATTIDGAALSGTFTGSPTLSGTVSIATLTNTTSMTTPSISINSGTALTTQTGSGATLVTQGAPTIQSPTFTAGAINGQLSAPSAPTITFSGTSSGSPTWTYKLVVYDQFGAETTASTGGSITTASNTTLSGSNYNIVTAGTLPVGGSGFNVYRTAVGTSPTTTGIIGQITSSGGTLNDTGLAADGSSVPTWNETGCVLPWANAGANNTSYGNYYITPWGDASFGGGEGASAAAGNATANELKLAMFMCNKTVTINNVTMDIVQNESGATVQWAIYRGDGKRKLFDVNMSAASTGAVTANTTSGTGVAGCSFPLTLWAGRTYWVAYSSSNASVTVMCDAESAFISSSFYNAVHVRVGYSTSTVSSGVSPATIGTPVSSGISMPLAFCEP